MKKILKRSTTVFSLTIILLSMIATAYASSYGTSYEFSVAVTGDSRYFNGSNIRFISPNADSSPSAHPSNTTYSVALYRDEFIDDFIGSKILDRDSYDTASWSNVGSGDYYVYLSKDNDGVTLIDNNVTIENY